MSNKTSQPEKVYFKNLNGVRFIAAFLVIIHHTEQLKFFLGLPNAWNNKIIFSIGGLGVILFFVLSGFLITYLLCKEQAITHSINVKYFYIRRILRIWPLYFLLVIAGFFILPHIGLLGLTAVTKNAIYFHFTAKLIMFALFLPNLALATFTPPHPFLSHTWSIGVEEQFYLIWPLLLKWSRNKWWTITTFLALCLFVRYLLPTVLPSGKYVNVFNAYINWTPVSCMVIGALFALLGISNHPTNIKIKNVLFKPIVQLLFVLLLFTFVGVGISFKYGNQEIYALIFGVIVFGLACSNKPIFRFHNKVLSYLGKISYGLYMFHPIVILLTIKLLQKINLLGNVLLYCLVFVFTIVIASFFYKFLEKPFIKIKINFSKIISGDNALIK